MLRIMVPDRLKYKAEIESNQMGSVHNSILKGKGNSVGFVGEMVVAELIGAERINTKDYDLVMPDGTKIDVKAKRTHYQPEDHYEASIAATSTHQQCDVYCFVRVLYNMSWAYVCGFYPKHLYIKDATYLKKGDYDPSNDFTVKWSCYNLPHHKLMDWDRAHDACKSATEQ